MTTLEDLSKKIEILTQELHRQRIDTDYALQEIKVAVGIKADENPIPVLPHSKEEEDRYDPASPQISPKRQSVENRRQSESVTTSNIPEAPGVQVRKSTLTDSHTWEWYQSRIILTTYPGQVGIKPVPLNWGAKTPSERGPVLVSRTSNTIRQRNAIGAYGGSYCIYRALAVAMQALPTDHRPDFTNTHPPIQVGPHPAWHDPTKIVSLDPYGHVTPQVFASYLEAGLDVRPTIAITRAHMRVPEIEEIVKNGSLPVDGQIILNKSGEITVTKAAVEPVWYLPGVAQRFGVEESNLRRALFEDTGGMYPELITRNDLKVFLPPIGGLTCYIFGNADYLSDASKHLTVRVHDECNGSDVFGSDICTCRPYLTYGIEECVRSAQKGGVGLIIYFRKEGRALGEVTKYLVYNARKRQEGGDQAATYFTRTECIAGVKDMRFQALMPDVLHWLGITKIDRFISMSNMKYDAMVQAGIPIRERVEIPENMIPPDSRVEIDAKIAAGYFTSGKVPTDQDLKSTVGRSWE